MAFAPAQNKIWQQAETGRRRPLMAWLAMVGDDRPTTEAELDDFAAIMGLYETADTASCGRCAESACGACAGFPDGSVCVDWCPMELWSTNHHSEASL